MVRKPEKHKTTPEEAHRLMTRMDLRLDAIKVFKDYTEHNGLFPMRTKMAKLLGYPNYMAFKLAHEREGEASERIDRQLRALTGPHGRVVFKMLLARSENPE